MYLAQRDQFRFSAERKEAMTQVPFTQKLAYASSGFGGSVCIGAMTYLLYLLTLLKHLHYRLPDKRIENSQPMIIEMTTAIPVDRLRVRSEDLCQIEELHFL